MKNHEQWHPQEQRGGKNGCPQPLDIVSLILSYSTSFFFFLIYIFACSNVGHTNWMKLKCMIVYCTNSWIIIDHSEIDGVDKDDE